MKGPQQVQPTLLRRPEPAHGQSPGRAAVNGGGNGLRVVTMREFHGSSVSPSEWNELVSASGGTVYQTWEWQTAWWKAFADPSRDALNILLFMVDGRTVGIAPLFRERIPAGNSCRLRLIGSGDAFSRSGGMFLDNGVSDYLDFIVMPEYVPVVAEMFIGYIAAADRDLRTIDLVNLRTSGQVMTGILPGLAPAGIHHTVTGGERCPFIPVSGDTADFIAQLGGSVRRRMNQAWKHLHDGNGLSVKTGKSESDLRAIFPELVRMHQRRWNRVGFPGLFMEARHRRFHEEIAHVFLKRGWLWFSAVYGGESCVAARLGFQFNGRMYDYLSGFDDLAKEARKRPGIALLLGMYDHARRSGCAMVDMLRGDEDYKFDLTGDSHTLANLRIIPGGSRGGGSRFTGLLGDVSEKTGFLLKREMNLFGVHVRTSGWPACIAGYLKFRGGRLMGKLHKMKTGTESTAGPPAKR